ncbi:MAG TPA: hypothetical protein VHT91_36460 [Kofleriaceae bacterium]|jgi:hypothetical protein|nr:hypothetical protein [Kofleriaceae bacterium]
MPGEHAAVDRERLIALMVAEVCDAIWRRVFDVGHPGLSPLGRQLPDRRRHRSCPEFANAIDDSERRLAPIWRLSDKSAFSRH